MSNVIDFNKRIEDKKAKRKIEDMRGSTDCAARMQRIRTSLEKINRLMEELKRKENKKFPKY